MSDQVKKWYQLGKPRDKESWEMYPSQVNAYYNPPANEVCNMDMITVRFRIDRRVQIVFPAGILRPPFFGEMWCV